MSKCLIKPVPLAKCPFCGSAQVDVDRDMRGAFYAVCRSCSAQGMHDRVKRDAVDAWDMTSRMVAA